MPVNFRHRVDDNESMENLNSGRLSTSGNVTNEDAIYLLQYTLFPK